MRGRVCKEPNANDVSIAYFIVVMQQGKELKCVPVQTSQRTSISLFPRNFIFSLSNIKECREFFHNS